ncbi:MAG: DUF1415 domain-containing protein [Noviherbaspirillum sp.]
MHPHASPILPDAEIIAATRHWLEKVVIGLNLCPFAKAVHVKNQIRYVVSRASDQQSLCQDLLTELENLRAADPAQVDTVLLIHPWALTDFLDYNDFLDIADAAVEELGLTGVMQIASFHPDYQFAGSAASDMGNYTNRSPYPMLHLLREASVELAVAAFPDAEKIFRRNISTLRRLGLDGWRALTEPESPSHDN